MWLSSEEEKCLLFEYEHEKSKPSEKSRRFVNANRLFYTLFIVSVLVFIGLYAAVSWNDKGINNYVSTVNDSKLTNDHENFTNSDSETSGTSENENSTIIPEFTSTESISTTQIPFKDDCSLPVYNPWDETLKPFLVDSDFTKNCDRNWKPYTELKNGTWRIVQEKPGMNCKARCHHFPDLTSSVNTSNWFEPGPTDCEFLEAACWEGTKEVYGYIHTQIPPLKRENLEQPEIQKSERPDVFVIILDSLSSNSAKRSLPKTLEHFKSKHGAVDFPFLSQVGTKSQMNAYALFFGKQVEAGTIKSGKRLEADWTEDDFCNHYLDDKPNIFRDFGDAGYTTLHIDDWYFQTLTQYPSCLGFEHYYTNHTFYPFTHINQVSGIKKTRNSLEGNDLCRESYHGAIDYFDQFTEAYSDRPMFALQWLVFLGHNSLTGAERGDAPILAWFERNFELFDNAFVILTADHGFRAGSFDYYQTEIGAFEKHNPFLQISVPKKYRDNGILEVMRENAQRLQSHYDTRATILDILKYQPSSNFTDRSTLKIPDEKGNSYLRHQPNFPRNCEHLPIPQQYCICKSKSTNMMNVDGLADRLGDALLKHIHGELARLNLSSLCHSFEVTNVLSLDLHGDSVGSKAMYHISVKTNRPAHFDAVITEDKETGKMEFGEIERLDRYGTTANCSAPIHFTSLCFCKK